jgi:hypothetical protein
MHNIIPIEVVNQYNLDNDKIKYAINITYKDEKSIIHSTFTTIILDAPGGLKAIYEYCFNNKLLRIYDVV